MVVEVPSLLSERPRTSENQFKMYSARVLSILSIYTGPTTHQTSNKIHTCAWRSKTLYSSSDLSFQFHMNKKGRVICEFETMKFKESFVCWRSNLTNDNISSAYARSENGYAWTLETQAWKLVWKMTIIWSWIGSGFRELGDTPTMNSQDSYPTRDPMEGVHH